MKERNLWNLLWQRKDLGMLNNEWRKKLLDWINHSATFLCLMLNCFLFCLIQVFKCVPKSYRFRRIIYSEQVLFFSSLATVFRELLPAVDRGFCHVKQDRNKNELWVTVFGMANTTGLFLKCDQKKSCFRKIFSGFVTV